MIFKLKKSLREHSYLLLLIVCMLIFILMKAPFLHLPFYWDEAWSYAKAVNEMYTHTPTLLPSHVNQEIFRGHPLFFYFVTSLFAHVSGFNPLSMHVWMLSISLLLLISFYWIVSKLHSSSVAFMATLFLLFQEIFIVQSSFLLPEILIAFLTIICFYFYTRQSYLLYFIAGSLLVLTKESGILAILAVCLHAILLQFKQKSFNIPTIKNLLLFASPFFIFIIFILLQKIAWGWYFFPAHIGLMDFSVAAVFEKLRNIFSFLLFFQNRGIYFVASLISLGVLYFYKRNIFLQIFRNKIVSLLLIFLILYVVFSAVNFYSPRYLLSLLPIYAILTALIIDSLFQQKIISTFISISIAVFFIGIYSFHRSSSPSDTSKGYIQSVQTQKDIFDNFIPSHSAESYSGGFLTSFNLQNKEAGYLQKGITPKVTSVDSANYMITSSIEPLEDKVNEFLKEGKIELVYEKTNLPAWCRVYKRIH